METANIINLIVIVDDGCFIVDLAIIFRPN